MIQIAQTEVQANAAPEQTLTFQDNTEPTSFKSAYFLNIIHVLKQLTKSSLYPLAIQKSFHLGREH